jgi:hypothetical protein
VLGGLAIALGVTGLWAQRTLGDPETFARLAGEILDDDEIRSELAIVIVDPVLDEAAPEIQQQRAFIVATTAGVLGDRRFVPLFQGVLRRAATDLLEGDGAVTLQLDRPLGLVVEEIEPVSPEVAAALAQIDPPAPEVVSSTQADRLRAVVRFERTVSAILVVVGAAFLVVAVIRGGPFALVPFGATLAGVSLVLLGLLLVGRGLLLVGVQPQSRADAAADAWGIVIRDLQTVLLLSVIGGAIAVVVGGVLARRRAEPYRADGDRRTSASSTRSTSSGRDR